MTALRRRTPWILIGMLCSWVLAGNLIPSISHGPEDVIRHEILIVASAIGGAIIGLLIDLAIGFRRRRLTRNP